MRILVLAATTVLALSASVAAQTAVGGRLIGFSGSGFAFTPSISRQQLCQPMAPGCATGITTARNWAGGAAYNATKGSLWLTQGTRMEERDVATCDLLCSTPAILTLGAGSVASGLAFSEARDEMYQLETVPGRAAVSIRHMRSCPANVLSVCSIALPTSRHVAGAVALDEQNGLLFYASSVFTPGGAPANTILVARLADPCTIICRFNAPDCSSGSPLGPIVAAAYDECSGLLYLSDGVKTASLIRGAATCGFQAVACCPIGISGASWFGFDIEPVHPRVVGSSCVGNNCRNCPNQSLVARGDPAIGNPAFGIDGVNLPAGATFFLGLSAGGCNAPGLPISCGFYHLGAPAIFLPGAAVGGVGCSGQVNTNIPIPANYSLCGLKLCAQGYVFCASPAGPGLSILNALELTISS